jgi:hypothetical protein
MILQLLSRLLLGLSGQLTKLLGTYTVLRCQIPLLRNALAPLWLCVVGSCGSVEMESFQI